MTPAIADELAKLRREFSAHELALYAANRLACGLERAQLVVPRPCTGRRRMRVLGGTKGVKTLWGEPCCENADGHTVVWVDAVDLLAWLAAYAGVRVETGGGK